MRKELEKMEGRRIRFRATVERFGTKKNYHGYPEPTVLVTDVFVADTSQLACDHLWFTVGKTIASLMLEPGDVIEFDARVSVYTKGYVSYREYIDEREADYKLSRPTNFKKREVLSTLPVASSC